MTARGFTIGEILVVSAVMAIIVGMAVPIHSRMREAARSEEARSNLAIISLAQKVYRMSDANGDFWCPGNLGSGPAVRNTINMSLNTDMSVVNWQFYTDNVRVNCAGGGSRFAARVERAGAGPAHYFCINDANNDGIYVITDNGASATCDA